MPLSKITGNSFNASANTNIDNGLLFLNPTTNRVGIGTTTPTRLLHLSSSGSNCAIRIDNTVSGRPTLIAYDDSQNLVITNSSDTGNISILNGTGAGTERLRIDSSGRLLINTTTARTTLDSDRSALVQIEGLSVDQGMSMFRNENGAFGPTFWIGKSRGTTAGSNTIVQNGDGLGSILFLGSDGTKPVQSALIAAYVDGTPGTNDMPGRLVFFTTADGASSVSERMRITSDGKLLVGATTNQVFSGVTADHAFIGPTGNGRWVTGFRNFGNSTPWGIVVGYSGASPNNTSQDFIWCEDTTAQRAAIRSNGGLANYSGNNANLSDRREKTNFAPAKNYIDIICSIPVQTFNYIVQNLEEDDGLTLGVVAQDVQAVAPELVTESNWGTEDNPKMRLSIYQTDLQYALMKCIQEQQAMIEELKQEIELLKSKE